MASSNCYGYGKPENPETVLNRLDGEAAMEIADTGAKVLAIWKTMQEYPLPKTYEVDRRNLPESVASRLIQLFQDCQQHNLPLESLLRIAVTKMKEHRKAIEYGNRVSE
jgi:hypothetical protein